jgi:tryptophan synthase beta chain
MLAYENYQAGNLNDYIPTDEDLAVSMDRLPKIPGIQE